MRAIILEFNQKHRQPKTSIEPQGTLLDAINEGLKFDGKVKGFALSFVVETPEGDTKAMYYEQFNSEDSAHIVRGMECIANGIKDKLDAQPQAVS